MSIQPWPPPSSPGWRLNQQNLGEKQKKTKQALLLTKTLLSRMTFMNQRIMDINGTHRVRVHDWNNARSSIPRDENSHNSHQNRNRIVKNCAKGISAWKLPICWKCTEFYKKPQVINFVSNLGPPHRRGRPQLDEVCDKRRDVLLRLSVELFCLLNSWQASTRRHAPPQTNRQADRAAWLMRPTCPKTPSNFRNYGLWVVPEGLTLAACTRFREALIEMEVFL